LYGTALSKDIVLSDVRLESKSGGVNSGDYVRGGGWGRVVVSEGVRTVL